MLRIDSVRVRTTLAATLAVGIALLIGGVALVATLQRSLSTGAKNTLQARLGDLVSRAKAGPLPDPLTLRGQPGALTQAIDGTGKVVAASSSYRDQPPLGRFLAPGSPPTAFTARLTADDELYQVVGMSTQTPARPVTIYAASSLEGLSDSATRLKTELVILLPLLLALVALTCWVVVGRALRPVEAIRARVAGVGARDLDRRVPEPKLDDEIGRLARTMNQMLDRLQTSSDRHRRFVADASHELRSPLASLRAQIEVEHAYAPADKEQEVSFSSQIAELDRMQGLVNDLLLLARADERAMMLRMQPLWLDQIVIDEAGRLTPSERVTIDTSGVRHTELRGDFDALTRAVRNLLENARRYARSRVDVALRSSNGRVRLTVTDDGPGVPAEERERVFERFARLDQGRSRSSGGAGLGLAIVREIVAAHGGTVRIEERAPGASFVVLLPERPASEPALD